MATRGVRFLASYLWDTPDENGYTYEVIDARNDSLVEMSVTEPFPMNVRYELLAAGPEATRAAIHARGDATGFYRLLAPIMNRMVRRNIRRDLEALARVLVG